MKLNLSFLLVASAAALSSSSSHARNSVSNLAQEKRGSPQAPDGYTPKGGSCPSTRPSIRGAADISPEETSWLSKRRPNTLGPMRDLLKRMDITGFDAASYIRKHQNDMSMLPNIGIAASGGGYRALMNGAGALSAFDSRTPGSTESGQLGGLLQSATYLAGLSGGGWLVGSIYSNNFTSVQKVLGGGEGSTWDFTNSIFDGPSGFLDSLDYYQTIYDQVTGKQDAGYDISVTDVWGRALAFQLINAEDGGPGYTWSSIADDSHITQGTAPLPVLVADGRAPGTKAIPTNTTIYEFNPFEFGSWDPTVFGFAPMKYVGSRFSGGQLPQNEDCVRGYDSASFIMGTSSSLFNQFAIQFSSSSDVLPSFVADFIQKLLNAFSKSEDDIASWVNPFYRYNTNNNPNAGTRELTLVDGGENLENIPLHPLLQPVRAVDVVIAIDSSADTEYFWPNGTSLVATYQRSFNTSLQNHTSFPAIPDQNTFVNLGLNARPTFFGCDAKNSTNSASNTPSPLIVYLPNTPYTAASNVSTFDPSYGDALRNKIILNGYNVATRGNASTQNWPTCLGCALLSRSLDRTGTTVPDVCKQCFKTYCWDGTRNSTTPPNFDPQPVISFGNTNTNAAAGRVGPPGGVWGVSLALGGLVVVGGLML